jgi:CBS domain-containing protein
MRELDVGSLPVCDGDRLEGMIIDRYITIRLVADGLDAARRKVSEIMTPGVTYCFDDQTVEEASTMMEAHQIRRLPINREKQLTKTLIKPKRVFFINLLRKRYARHTGLN